jgi:hypothetical protein
MHVKSVRALSNGVARWPLKNAPHIAMTFIGENQSRVLVTRTRASLCSASLQVRMAQIALAEFLLVTEVVIGCIGQCTLQVWLINRPLPM